MYVCGYVTTRLRSEKTELNELKCESGKRKMSGGVTKSRQNLLPKGNTGVFGHVLVIMSCTPVRAWFVYWFEQALN